MKKWYRSWFNSPYYHVLYSNRDYKEAELFIDNIYKHLKPQQFAKVLDACCGRGRHSIYLNKKGLDVTGIDLSHQSIQYAKKFENEHLHFAEHDIRGILSSNTYDYVFNIFTSFGYFKRQNEDIKAIKSFSKALKPNGYLLIDFLNIGKINKQIKPSETKIIDGINFHIEKKLEHGMIIKSIMFEDQGRKYEFKEEVKALSFDDFKRYCELSQLEIIETFGDYHLNKFDFDTSERMILLAQKK
jgi:SAM-dependent methyltransferase